MAVAFRYLPIMISFSLEVNPLSTDFSFAMLGFSIVKSVYGETPILRFMDAGGEAELIEENDPFLTIPSESVNKLSCLFILWS
jgi:hypothetical protein